MRAYILECTRTHACIRSFCSIPVLRCKILNCASGAALRVTLLGTPPGFGHRAQINNDRPRRPGCWQKNTQHRFGSSPSPYVAIFAHRLCAFVCVRLLCVAACLPAASGTWCGRRSGSWCGTGRSRRRARCTTSRTTLSSCTTTSPSRVCNILQ